MKTPRTVGPRTDCNDQPLLFHDRGARPAVADCSGGYRSRDGGALLLRQLDRGLGLTRSLAPASTDRDDPLPAAARVRRCLTGAPSAGVFADLESQPRQSWSCQRRVVAKAEVMAAGDNPRCVVTNLPASGVRGEDRQGCSAAHL